MAKPYDTRLVMLVAQYPFETQDMNQFCKLVPVVYTDGVRPSDADFPNDGEVWWMLIARTAPLAVPGKILLGVLENAVRYDERDPTSSRYQVQRDTIRELEPKDGYEILTIPTNAVGDVQELVAHGFRQRLDTPPMPQVLVRWRGNVYGPFRTGRDASAWGPGNYAATFATLKPDMSVYRIPEAAFDEATKPHRMVIDDEISLTQNRRTDGYSLARCKHELLLAAGYDRCFQGSVDRLVLEPLDQKLQRFAKKCLTRSKNQSLRTLLQELETTGPEAGESDDLLAAVRQMKGRTDAHDAALTTVTRAMLESGLLGEDRILRAVESYAEKYVEKQSAELQAKVQDAVAGANAELRSVEADLKDVRTRLQKEEADRRAVLDAEIASERAAASREIETERSRLTQEKNELDYQRQVLQKNLEQVTAELRDAGDGVLNRFLTIAPLLGAIGLTGGARSEVPDTSATRKPAPPFQLPAYISTTAAANAAPLSEDAFFDRFRNHVEQSGFVYRPLDLQRFHLSVKCGEMTVLGGPSGTGKSSLPALYARALQGEEAAGRPDCLMVNVNPSWMDIRDLLGHLNTLEGHFYPTESGLFQHLVYAQEEYAAQGSATGLYLTCLDEMNLSQVEHYFSDFMMVLDREESARFIQCFSPEVVKPSCPFRAYARLRVSPGFKFIGTVNFDETTRLLSDRFLDRVNLVQLSSASLPSVAKSEGEAVAPSSGRRVTLADFAAWRTDAALPSNLGSLLDTMRPLLSQCGCPLSPRVYRAICRFVASAGPVMSPEVAFDVQVAQRIVPKVRGLVTKKQLESLDAMLKLINSARSCGFDESLPLLETIHESTGHRVWDLEE